MNAIYFCFIPQWSVHRDFYFLDFFIWFFFCAALQPLSGKNSKLADLGGTRSTPLFLINLILYTSHHKYTLRPSTPTDTYMNMYVTSYTGCCNTRMQIRDRRRARCTLRRRTFGAWHDEALCTVPRLLYTFQPIMMSTRIRCVHSAPRPHQRASGTAPSG